MVKEKYQNPLEEWDRRVSRSVESHYESAKKLRTKHYTLGVIAVILVSSMGALKGIESESFKELISNIYTIVTIISAILVGLQTFLNYSQRGEKHKEAASEYGSIRREIEHLAKRTPNSEKELEEIISSIKLRLDTLSKTTPEVLPKIWKKVKTRFKKDTFKSRIFN